MKRLFHIALFFLGGLPFVQAQVDTTSMSDDKKALYKNIEGYRQRVLKGESMAALATLYTEDPGSARTGGAYYNIARGVFVPEFEKAAFSLVTPGSISEVFETNYGFHFVQLIGKHDDVIDVRHILIKTNK